MKETPSSRTSPPADPVRAERLRRDAARPMHVNLAEGIALSHKLIRFAGAAASAARR